MDHQGTPSAGGDSPLFRPVQSLSDINSGRRSEPSMAISDDTISLSRAQLTGLIDQSVKAAIKASGSTGFAKAGASGVGTPRAAPRGHTLSESSDEGSDGRESQGTVVSGIPESIGLASRDTGFDFSIVDLVAKDNVQPSAPAPVPGSVVDLITQDWGAIYNDEEVFGPPVSDSLADLVNRYVRCRPSDEQLRKAQAEVLIPSNCKGLSVPLLNKDFEGVFAYKHGVFMERQLCRQIGLVCKAVGPLVRLLDDWQNDSATPAKREHVKGVSDSVRLLISAINLQNFTRKQNVMSCVRDPYLKPLCTWDTQVGETSLFPVDVADQLAALKKKYKIAASDTRPQKGSKRAKRDFAHSSQRGGGKGFSPKGNSSGGGKKRQQSQQGQQEQSFLAKGSKGKGKTP